PPALSRSGVVWLAGARPAEQSRLPAWTKPELLPTRCQRPTRKSIGVRGGGLPLNCATPAMPPPVPVTLVADSSVPQKFSRLPARIVLMATISCQEKNPELSRIAAHDMACGESAGRLPTRLGDSAATVHSTESPSYNPRAGGNESPRTSW